MTRVRVIGVPSSAGAYCVGVEGAPAALREAGLIAALRSRGIDVRDDGDLTERRWRPDPSSPFAQNVDDEAASLREFVDALGDPLAHDERMLVLGGSCTVAVGACAALDRAGGSARLVYIDRHLDLNTPSSTLEGSLSWMGMAHALGLPGTVEAVSGLGRSRPMLAPTGLSYLGVDVEDATEWEREQLREQRIALVSQAALVDDPVTAARRARAALPPGPFAVHIDVDVLDFLDAPLAENLNGRNTGPTIEQAGAALRELCADDDLRILSTGQLDPHHASSSPDALRRFASALADALAPVLR